MKRIKKLCINHKGITLVEILVVVAIISIIIGGIGISISLMYSRDAERAAKIIDTSLESARMGSMSQKGTFSTVLDIENNILNIIQNKTGGGKEIIESKSLPGNITITLKEADGVIDLSAAKKIEISFNKSVGKVREFRVDEVTPVDTNMITITCRNNSGKKASIIIIKLTGKHYIEY